MGGQAAHAGRAAERGLWPRVGAWTRIAVSGWMLTAPVAGCGPGEGTAALPTVAVQRRPFARVVEADGTLKPQRATPVTVPSDVPWSLRITWVATDGATVKKGDALFRFDDMELQARLVDARADKTVSMAQRQKEELLQRVARDDRMRSTQAAQRDLEMTRAFPRKDPTIFARDQIIEAEIDARHQEAKLEHAQKSERADRELSKNKLGLIDVEAKKADEAIRRVDKGLRALLITAPHDGVFTLRKSPQGETLRVGDTVSRSMQLADVSTVDRMEAEVFVIEAEAAGLAEGRKAEIAIEAQPDRLFAGRVTQIETVAKRRQTRSPTQYFGVTLSLEKTIPELMKPGQRVRARLVLNELTALVVPRPALFDREGRWIVYRKAGPAGWHPVEVKLGPSSAGLATVESGLQEGDVIALREPGKRPDELFTEPRKAKGGRP